MILLSESTGNICRREGSRRVRVRVCQGLLCLLVSKHILVLLTAIVSQLGDFLHPDFNALIQISHSKFLLYLNFEESWARPGYVLRGDCAFRATFLVKGRVIDEKVTQVGSHHRELG